MVFGLGGKDVSSNFRRNVSDIHNRLTARYDEPELAVRLYVVAAAVT